jgi:hypothetical protein
VKNRPLNLGLLTTAGSANRRLACRYCTGFNGETAVASKNGNGLRSRMANSSFFQSWLSWI